MKKTLIVSSLILILKLPGLCQSSGSDGGTDDYGGTGGYSGAGTYGSYGGYAIGTGTGSGGYTGGCVYGCTKPESCNFNSAATCDNGSCKGVRGCTNHTACNYAAAATCDDGSCKETPHCFTGIDNLLPSSAISLYPNPANNKLVAQSEAFATGHLFAFVYDLTGRIMPVNYMLSGDNISFDIGNLAPGMYWLKFNIDEQEATAKFVKIASGP